MDDSKSAISLGSELYSLFAETVNVEWEDGTQFDFVVSHLKQAASVGIRGVMLYDGDFGFHGFAFDTLFAMLRRHQVYCNMIDQSGFLPRRLFVYFV